jgi:hypothetical protein
MLFAVRKNLQRDQFSTGGAVLSLPRNCNLLHISPFLGRPSIAKRLISQVAFFLPQLGRWNSTCNVTHVNKVYYLDGLYGIIRQ